MDLLLSILAGIFFAAVTLFVGEWLKVPAPLPAIAAFFVFIVVAFYGRTWFKPRV